MEARLVRLRLLDDVRHLADARRNRFLQRHDSIFVRVLLGNILHAEHAALMLVEHFDHLLEARNLRIDQIVREMHHERRIADHRPRAQHGVAQTQRRRLADVYAGSPARQNSAQGIQQILFALRLQYRLEFRIRIEVILDRALRTAGDEYQGVGAGRQRFIDRILNQRLVHDGKHFLRTCLGDRKKSRAASGNGKYGGFYWVLSSRKHSGFPRAAPSDNSHTGADRAEPSAQLDDRVRLEAVPGMARGTVPIKIPPREAALIAAIFLRLREQRANFLRDARRLRRAFAPDAPAASASCEKTFSIDAAQRRGRAQVRGNRGKHQAPELVEVAQFRLRHQLGEHRIPLGEPDELEQVRKLFLQQRGRIGKRLPDELHGKIGTAARAPQSARSTVRRGEKAPPRSAASRSQWRALSKSPRSMATLASSHR